MPIFFMAIVLYCIVWLLNKYVASEKTGFTIMVLGIPARNCNNSQTKP